LANPPRTGNFRVSPQEADFGVDSGADPVLLAAAPARFVAETWARLAALKGSGEKALAALDHPDPAMLVVLRRENLALSLLDLGRRAAAEAQEAAYALGLSLVEAFRALGAQGLIVARGIFAGTGVRQAAPAELWPEARFGFAANAIEAGAFAWKAVTVEPAPPPARAASAPSEMRAWLEARRINHGDELKKALRPAAEAEFGEAFTVRAFNAAYADCYRRARGRPKRG
jgi:hypothetical protein